MKRAVEASKPLGPPTAVPEKSQTSASQVPTPAVGQLKDSSKLATPHKGSPSSVVQKETSEAVTPQRKTSTSSMQSGKPETATAPLKQTSPAPEKPSQETPETGPKKPSGQTSQPIRKQSDSTTATQQESGGLFGFGGPKSQHEAAKPAVTGKMFGFGSSIFSSASSLITSAVQDQPKTTPPVSPKMSPTKEIRSPSAQKVEQQKKTEPPQQTRMPQTGQAKMDKAQPERPKAGVNSQVAVKPGSSNCPLCKVELNMGSKDPPNYNTCTECKNTVCNQCGFNPMLNETAVRLEKTKLFLLQYHSTFNTQQTTVVHDIYCFMFTVYIYCFVTVHSLFSKYVCLCLVFL